MPIEYKKPCRDCNIVDQPWNYPFKVYSPNAEFAPQVLIYESLVGEFATMEDATALAQELAEAGVNAMISERVTVEQIRQIHIAKKGES